MAAVGNGGIWQSVVAQVFFTIGMMSCRNVTVRQSVGSVRSVGSRRVASGARFGGESSRFSWQPMHTRRSLGRTQNQARSFLAANPSLSMS